MRHICGMDASGLNRAEWDVRLDSSDTEYVSYAHLRQLGRVRPATALRFA